jgi:hypothetical protein
MSKTIAAVVSTLLQWLAIIMIGLGANYALSMLP